MIDRIREIEEGLGPRADEIKEAALAFAASARERWAGGSNAVREFVERSPFQAIGVAFGVGVALGWLIKRR